MATLLGTPCLTWSRHQNVEQNYSEILVITTNSKMQRVAAVWLADQIWAWVQWVFLMKWTTSSFSTHKADIHVLLSPGSRHRSQNSIFGGVSSTHCPRSPSGGKKRKLKTISYFFHRHIWALLDFCLPLLGISTVSLSAWTSCLMPCTGRATLLSLAWNWQWIWALAHASISLEDRQTTSDEEAFSDQYWDKRLECCLLLYKL